MLAAWWVVPVLLVSAVDDAELQRRVGAHLEKTWAEKGITPAPRCTDDVFLRRVTLDLAGRVPTLQEVDEFGAMAPADRRAAWVDRLLGSRDTAQYRAHLLATLLTGSENRSKARARDALEEWLATEWARGTTWDVMVRKIVTVEGTTEDHPEANWALLVARDKENGANNAVTALTTGVLGIQAQCAQCHDHPYDTRYTQRGFQSFAAIFARTRVKKLKGSNEKTFEVRETRNPRGGPAGLPGVAPAFLGRPLDVSGGKAREALARELVASDLFAKAHVNHGWMTLFGRGLVHPWNDLGGERDSSHPAVLVELADAFRAHGHDVKWLLRTLVLSDAYMRSSTGGSGPNGDPLAPERAFARAAVRPLGAWQLVHSVVAATGLDQVVAARQGEETAARRLRQALQQYTHVFADDEMDETSGGGGNVTQALLLFNSPLVTRGVQATRGSTLQSILEQHRKDPSRVVNRLHQLAYARDASAAELSSWESRTSGARADAEDLLAAMLASAEFVTNH